MNIFLVLAADGAGVRTVLEPITAGKVVRNLRYQPHQQSLNIHYDVVVFCFCMRTIIFYVSIYGLSENSMNYFNSI